MGKVVAPAERKSFTLPVGSFKFKVEFAYRVASKDDPNEDLDGLYEPDTDTITIKRSLSPDRQRQTIWHEVIHAILAENSYAKLSADEKLVDLLAHSIVQIRKSVRWL